MRMSLKVWKDLFDTHHSNRIIENIQENPKMFMIEGKEKRKCLQDISNKPKHQKLVGKQKVLNEAKHFSMEQNEYQGDMKFSNEMKDACKTICQICKASVFLTTLRGHTRSRHNVTIVEYKKVYGNQRNNIIEKVYHKCAICQKNVLLDSDEISHHLKKNHSISHKNYNAEYMIIKNKEKITQKEDNCESSIGKDKLSASLKIYKGKETITTKEGKCPTTCGQQIDGLKKEDFKNMSTEELLKAIDLVLS
jgi:hypothetical protein